MPRRTLVRVPWHQVVMVTCARCDYSDFGLRPLAWLRVRLHTSVVHGPRREIFASSWNGVSDREKGRARS